MRGCLTQSHRAVGRPLERRSRSPVWLGYHHPLFLPISSTAGNSGARAFTWLTCGSSRISGLPRCWSRSAAPNRARTAAAEKNSGRGVELLKAPTPDRLEVLVSHANAPLTVEGRRRLCLRVDAGRAPRARGRRDRDLAPVPVEVARPLAGRWRSRAHRPVQPSRAQSPPDTAGEGAGPYRAAAPPAQARPGPHPPPSCAGKASPSARRGCTGCWSGWGSAGYVSWTGPPASSCAHRAATSAAGPVS